jgi:hypothetical protein
MKWWIYEARKAHFTGKSSPLFDDME